MIISCTGLGCYMMYILYCHVLYIAEYTNSIFKLVISRYDK